MAIGFWQKCLIYRNFRDYSFVITEINLYHGGMRKTIFHDLVLVLCFGLPLAGFLTACESNLGADIAGAEAGNMQQGSLNSSSQMMFYTTCTGSGIAVQAVGTSGYQTTTTEGQINTVPGSAEVNANTNPCLTAWSGAQVTPQIQNNLIQSYAIQSFNGTSLQVSTGSPSTGVLNGATYLTCQTQTAYSSPAACSAGHTALVSCPAISWYVCSN
jgi:hypothetical protein